MVDENNNNNPLINNLPGEDQPWALESTQEKILNEFKEYVSKYVTSNSDELEKISRNAELAFRDKSVSSDIRNLTSQDKKSTEKQITQFELLRNEFEESSKKRRDQTQKLTQSFERSSKQISQKTESAAEKLATFDGDLIGLFESLSRQIPILGVALGGLAFAVRNNIEAYQTLAEVGHTFNSDMFEMATQIHENALTLKQGTALLTKFNNIASRIGSRTLLTLQKEVRDAASEFGNFGFTTERLTQITGNYIEQLLAQQQFEQFNQMTRRQRNNLTNNYIARLQVLSRVTGRQAEQIEKSTKETLKSSDAFSTVAMVQMRYGKEAAQNFQGNMQTMTQMSHLLPEQIRSEIMPAMKSMAMTGHLARSELGKIAEVTGLGREPLHRLFDIMRSGNASVDDISQVYEDYLGQIAKVNEQGGQTAETLALMGINGNQLAQAATQQQEAILESRTSIRNFGKELNFHEEVLKAQDEASDGVTQQYYDQMFQMAQTTGRIKARMQPALAELTLTFTRLSEIVIKNINEFVRNGGIEKVANMLATSFRHVSNIVSSVGNLMDSEFGAAMKTLAEHIDKVIVAYLGVKFLGAINTVIGVFGGLVTAARAASAALMATSIGGKLGGVGRGIGRTVGRAAGAVGLGGATATAAGTVGLGSAIGLAGAGLFSEGAKIVVDYKQNKQYETLDERIKNVGDGIFSIAHGYEKIKGWIFGQEGISYGKKQLLEAAEKQKEYYEELKLSGKELTEQQKKDLKEIEKLQQHFYEKYPDLKPEKEKVSELANMGMKAINELGQFSKKVETGGFGNVLKPIQVDIQKREFSGDIKPNTRQYDVDESKLKDKDEKEVDERRDSSLGLGRMSREGSFDEYRQELITEVRRTNDLLQSIAGSSENTAKSVKKNEKSPLESMNLNTR